MTESETQSKTQTEKVVECNSCRILQMTTTEFLRCSDGELREKIHGECALCEARLQDAKTVNQWGRNL